MAFNATATFGRQLLEGRIIKPVDKKAEPTVYVPKPKG